MANEENLKPFNGLAPEERRKLAQKGGKASGAARRRNKYFREYGQMVLNLRPKATKKLMREWEDLGYDCEAEGLPTVAERLAMSLAKRAEGHDDNALRLLMSYTHNPTMSEKLRADEIKAMADGTRQVEVNVNREDETVMEGIRALIKGENP